MSLMHFSTFLTAVSLKILTHPLGALIMLPVHDYLVILSDTEKFTWNKPTQVSLSGK